MGKKALLFPAPPAAGLCCSGGRAPMANWGGVLGGPCFARSEARRIHVSIQMLAPGIWLIFLLSGNQLSFRWFQRLVWLFGGWSGEGWFSIFLAMPGVRMQIQTINTNHHLRVTRKDSLSFCSDPQRRFEFRERWGGRLLWKRERPETTCPLRRDEARKVSVPSEQLRRRQLGPQEAGRVVGSVGQETQGVTNGLVSSSFWRATPFWQRFTGNPLILGGFSKKRHPTYGFEGGAFPS